MDKLFDLLSQFWLDFIADTIPIEIEDLLYIVSFIGLLLIILSPLLLVLMIVWFIKGFAGKKDYYD